VQCPFKLRHTSWKVEYSGTRSSVAIYTFTTSRYPNTKLHGVTARKKATLTHRNSPAGYGPRSLSVKIRPSSSKIEYSGTRPIVAIYTFTTSRCPNTKLDRVNSRKKATLTHRNSPAGYEPRSLSVKIRPSSSKMQYSGTRSSVAIYTFTTSRCPDTKLHGFTARKKATLTHRNSPAGYEPRSLSVKIRPSSSKMEYSGTRSSVAIYTFTTSRCPDTKLHGFTARKKATLTHRNSPAGYEPRSLSVKIRPSSSKMQYSGTRPIIAIYTFTTSRCPNTKLDRVNSRKKATLTHRKSAAGYEPRSLGV
jgi:hypothetical protein